VIFVETDTIFVIIGFGIGVFILIGCMIIYVWTRGLFSPFLDFSIDVFKSGTEGYHTFRIPAILTLPNNTIIVFCEGRKNSQSDFGYINMVMKRSIDNGKTWSKPEKSEFPNPNSQVCIATLRSGKVIMAFNNTQKGRSPLSLTISSDRGYTWHSPKNLENDPEMEYSYPCLLQTPDQIIHLSYTYRRKSIKYCVFDETWLNQQFPTATN
jgi:Neuraminidase (sialidase)